MKKIVETALPKCRQTKSAYQVLKKEIEKQVNLFFGTKLSEYHALEMFGQAMRFKFSKTEFLIMLLNFIFTQNYILMFFCILIDISIIFVSNK